MLQNITLSDLTRVLQQNEQIDETKTTVVKEIINQVRINKDKALREYTERFDRVKIERFRVSEEEINQVFQNASKQLIDDLTTSYNNILLYHSKQVRNGYEYATSLGDKVGQIVRPIDSVGLYIPGGTASYPSTVLMSAAPAVTAGVKRIVMISPPNTEGKISDIILVAAKVAGITEIYTCGGAQGIAALAYGTESILPVNKIVGPGNIYVAIAKKEVFGTVGIDMIAGPSEILICADSSSNPAFVAADLLSQAEHDTLAKVMLISSSQKVIDEVNIELEKQLALLSRSDIARQSIKDFGFAIKVSSESEAIQAINIIAPEHLELMVENAENWIPQINNAGAIFIGDYSPEALGDYAAGPNHTLPTSGTATFSSPLSVDDFITKTSIIQYTKKGLFKLKDTVARLAKGEGLTAHENAVLIRYNDEN